MIYYISGISYSSNDLYHHGIKGQKWGSRNGPPYPLKPGDHSKDEKEAESKSNSKTAFKIDKSTLVTVGKVAAVAALATIGIIAVKKISEDRSVLDSQRKYGQILSDEIRKIHNSDEYNHGTVDKVRRYFQQRENSSEFDSNNLVYKKKREMSSDEDLLYVNPEFGSYERASFNCGLCSMTYDMRRRGYDVTAGFSDKGINLGTLKSFYKGASEQVLAGDYYRVHTGAQLKPLNDKSAKKAISELSKQTSTRGILSMSWAGRNSGHMVSYEVDSNGKVTIIDGQSSNIYSGENLVKLFTKTSALAAVRTDNCEPNILQMVTEGVIR